jgi:GH15 family glucan-1,4-alpha-glucosidase
LKQNLDLALIGNSSASALIDAETRVVWACLPRFDSDPVFDALLKDHSPIRNGFYQIELLDLDRTEQEYVTNTAVVVTRLYDSHGGVAEVIDFAPRFKQFGRTFRPLTLVRMVRPLAGSPRIRVLLRPTSASSGVPPAVTHGSNHIRYLLPDVTLRLTTDASITTVLDEVPFILERPMTLVLGPDETLQRGVAETGRHFYEETVSYWHEWVRYLGIPFEWQDAVIRAAITLKLNAFDDTGAIVAAMTTSIPEAPATVRNWDYRYCWLRDAQFVVGALNRLGVTKTMENYLSFIVNVTAGSADGRLQPVYGINGRAKLEERIVEALPGYRGMGPVRFGNQAYEQIQNDVYGSAVLAATHMFFDRRLARPGDEALFRRLEHLGELAVSVFDEPDAGPWELRGDRRVHTYSAVMCWAACDRLVRIAARLGLEERARHWRRHAERMHGAVVAKAFNAKLGSFTGSFGGEELDATLLLLPELGFLPAADPRFVSTVRAVEKQLLQGDYLFRYRIADDFGRPETAFVVCSFWYVDALKALGRETEARELFEKLLSRRNRHGLLSEDLDPETGELWGNFPQTYSMVGLINSARKLSQPWDLGN